jgi:hypothetical protein
MEEERGGQKKKIRKKEPYNLYPSPDITRTINTVGMRWQGQIIFCFIENQRHYWNVSSCLKIIYMI